jgi:hypothetical protein
LDSHAGLNGVVWFTALVIATVFSAMFRLLLLRGTNLLIALVLTLLAMYASTIHFLARPHVLSWLFALVWFWILSSDESASDPRISRRIWLLPLLMLIWVNVHGGFLLGFVLLAIFWLGSLWTWSRLDASRIEEALEKIAAGKRVRQLTLVGLVSATASLVNPYGWHLHKHIYTYLTNRFFMDHIDEFQSPNFHRIAQRCFLLLLLIAIAALIAKGRKLRPSEILVVLFAIYAGLYASRNIPISSILLAAIVGPLLPSARGIGFLNRMGAVDAMVRGHFWPIIASVATFVLAMTGGRVGSSVLMDAHFDPRRMPVDAVNFVTKAGIRGPVFGPDYWGGYLIYRLYPHNKVVIDDRHDFYRVPLLQMYLRTFHVEPGWEDFLKGRSCVLVPRKNALTEILRKTPEWKAIYSDDLTTVFMPGLPQDSDRLPSH